MERMKQEMPSVGGGEQTKSNVVGFSHLDRVTAIVLIIIIIIIIIQ